MLKPGEPSAFLKVDPSYLHHWQQLFPQTPQTPPGQTPSGQSTPGQTPPGRTPPGQTSPGQTPPGQRVSVPGESLRATRLNHHLISSTNCSSTTSSAAPTPSSTSCPSGSSVASSLAGLSQLPVPQHIALFGPGSGDSAAGLHPDPRGLHPEPRDLHSDGPPSCAVVSSSGRSSGGPCPPSCRGRLTSEQLDYYLYGQQRMEIIPLNPHSGDLNHRKRTALPLSLR
ncbi:putative histone-lysine N-methyltransferase PRDM6 [Gadus chalcogrammus]|uniref:putative histone-lysine N-methyltransferase PRDM6 n=1 Tax=Gadus chalcogrammus TaxID=1042646 RepID=UPI0024C22808|nr:putative histone-lysine N-methyltransferase PRDM6 [Gadus chalcogrammus]